MRLRQLSWIALPRPPAWVSCWTGRAQCPRRRRGLLPSSERLVHPEPGPPLQGPASPSAGSLGNRPSLPNLAGGHPRTSKPIQPRVLWTSPAPGSRLRRCELSMLLRGHRTRIRPSPFHVKRGPTHPRGPHAQPPLPPFRESCRGPASGANGQRTTAMISESEQSIDPAPETGPSFQRLRKLEPLCPRQVMGRSAGCSYPGTYQGFLRQPPPVRARRTCARRASTRGVLADLLVPLRST